MAINSKEVFNSDEESEYEVEVDLKVELISALKELKKVRKENTVLKEHKRV